MRCLLIFISVFTLQFNSQAQLLETFNLPKKLNEASGLEQLNDATQ